MIIMVYLYGMKWECVREILKRVGVFINVYEFGIDFEVIIEVFIIVYIIRFECYIIFGKDGLIWEVVEKVVKIIGVI